jgi:tetratricopeptide (TPR) repeat protein
MSQLFKNRALIFVTLLSLVLLASACKPSAEKLIQDGNDQFEEEAYLEALAVYQQANFEDPELAEPYYNAANALYRQGAYGEALTLMQEALNFADEESLIESSLFNIGNSTYNTQDFAGAVDAYKQALLVDPDDQDAKYNLELALQQQEQQEQEQEQEQDQEQQEQEEQEDQEQEGGSDQQESEDQSQDGQDQEQDQGQEGEQEQEQDQSQDEQSEEQPNSEQEDGQGQPQDGQDQEEGQPSQMPPPGQRMTAEQARQLLAAIAQDSETLQERLGQIFVAPPIPPVQDW